MLHHPAQHGGGKDGIDTRIGKTRLLEPADAGSVPPQERLMDLELQLTEPRVRIVSLCPRQALK